MTYVSNTIRIPTYGVDFYTNGSDLGRELEISNEDAVNRGEKRKKEMRKKEKVRGALLCLVVALGWLVRLLHKLRRLT
jgi:hypothetical protein